MTPPTWLERAAAAAGRVPTDFFARHRPAGSGERESAVLILVGPDPDREGEQRIVLTERAGGLRSHAGQMAFPGGRVDADDDGPVGAALREATEEIDLEPAGVDVLTTFPRIHVPVSNSAVTPVLAWWSAPAPIRAHSPAEVAGVVQVPVPELLDPGNRFTVTHPVGYRGVGFGSGDLFIWGFTAALLDRLFVLADIDRPWDPQVTRPLPPRFSAGRAPMITDEHTPRRRREDP